MEIRSAGVGDAAAISALLIANSDGQGGALLGDWSSDVVRGLIEGGALVIVAYDGARLAGALFTEEKMQAVAPPVIAMLRAWPGSIGAYVYGPVCVAQDFRGRGVLEALYADLVARRSGREAILFIRASNVASLRAHARLGMREVAHFSLGGETVFVLSDAPDGKRQSE
jgi:ribosomal protein S18 acetylase RimI-like enzyme